MKDLLKKVGKIALSGMVAYTFLAQTIQTTTKAAESDNVKVQENTDTITIGNEYLEREFSIKNQKLTTNRIVNKRTTGGNTIFQPAEGSEEFIFKTIKEAHDPISLPKIDRTGWTATADSYQNATGNDDGPASNLLNDNLNAIWHSKYNESGTGRQSFPYSVVFDLNKDVEFQSFSYTPRQNGENTNGNILGYELYIANTDSDISIESTDWVKVSAGNFEYDGVNPIFVNLNEKVSANKVKLVAVSSKNGANFAGGAEFNLHAEKAPVIIDDRSFAASDLTLQENGVSVEATTATINHVTKTGKKVSFAFEPYTFKDVTYTITENIVMYEGDHFMRKYMEISVPNDQKDQAVIDYIDLESLKVNENDATWTIPTDAGGIVAMDQFKANLGQPIYIQGMFMGCEFPLTDTEIVDNTGYMRYYSGKTFTRLGQDNQLVNDASKATYVTWQTVVGAARSTENDVIQSDFYDYIHSIATPSEFRIQYNSWFDNMMRIDDDNILESFIEIDKELNKVETRPLDSYVVDDGWNNYNKDSVVDAVRSGTSLNTSGFWEFNTKFPDGLTPSSELVHNFGSNFGVWIGPRGGYNFYGTLADILVASGKGSKAGGSIDVADREYVKNFKEMAIDWQEQYQVNYWKWDGFADNAQYNAFAASDGVPGYANRHMTGGYSNMYHVTDLWEAWIDLMEAVRQNAEANDIQDLWISLTCYVNPSPWFLQWANSVWIQCTADQADAGSSTSKMDRQLTYRDACYYDFLKNHEFQFPLSNLYNHDPVYGKEGTGMGLSTATDDQFQNYLYMLSTRGTAFWELYYSDSIMTDGKYEVTSEFLKWAEENYHILKHSKMIGNTPNAGTTLGGNGGGENNAYGYACFDGTDGIISLRNPATSAKTISFTFDRTIGVPENAGTLEYYFEHSHNLTPGTSTTGTLKYGKTYDFTLQPDEVRILRISSNGDTTAPEFTRVMSEGNKTIRVKFNEKVKGRLFEIEGAKIASIQKSADDVSFVITLADELTDGQTVKVIAKDIKDLSGNALATKEATVKFYSNNTVLDESEQTVSGVTAISNNRSLESNNGFSVIASVTTSSTGSILKQENGYELGINSDGKAYFTLNGTTTVSKATVHDAQKHTIVGVKENNGILKLYVDGTLNGAAYQQENQYYSVHAGNTILGNDSFNGSVAVTVKDIALGYDEVANLFNTDRTPLDTDGMMVAVSGTSEGDRRNIFDGNPETYWTSQEETGGIAKGNPYLTIDLNGKYLLDRFDYIKRFYNSPANYWKCTGNLHDYILEVSNDNGTTWTEVSSGPTSNDHDSTQENMTDGTTQITFAPVEATHVRISGTSSHHWNTSQENHFMTVADVKLYGEKITQNLALHKPTKIHWTANDNTVDAAGNNVINSTDRPASMINDGIKNNAAANYVDFGKDGVRASAYVQIDLEKLCDITSLHMYRYWSDNRTYAATVIALSENEDFSNPTIVFNSDADNVHGFGAGSDALYQETLNGKDFPLTTPVAARYVRVYVYGVKDGGTTNHIVELEVNGSQRASAPVDLAGLIERLSELSNLDVTNVTTASRAEYNALMDEGYDLLTGKVTEAEIQSFMEKSVVADVQAKLVDVTALMNLIDQAEATADTKTISSVRPLLEKIQAAKALLENGTVDTIATMMTQLEDAKNDASLVERGNTDALKELIDSYQSLKETNYTAESWAAYKTVLNQANAIVADNSDSSQDDVDAVKAELEAKKNALVVAGEVSNVDKDALNAKITEAENIDKNLYTTSSVKAMEDVLIFAQECSESTTVTQEKVDETTQELSDVILALKTRADVKDGSELLQAIQAEDLKESAYTSATWSVFMDAKTALMNAVNDNSDTNEEQMAELIKAVNDTKAALKKVDVIDKSALNALIEKVKDANESEYESAYWTEFKNALDAAKLMMESNLATQDQVNGALDKLQTAYDNLLAHKKTDKPNQPDHPNPPQDPENPNPPQDPEKPNPPLNPEEPVKPGFVTEIINKETDITVKGLFPVNTELHVDKIIGTKLHQILNTIKDKEIVKKYQFEKVFDIYMMRNDVVYNIDGTITVQIKLEKALQNKELKVLYIADNGMVTEIPCTIKDHVLSFKTTHNSYYAIVTEKSSSNPITNTGVDPINGTMVSIVLVGILMIYLTKKMENVLES